MACRRGGPGDDKCPVTPTPGIVRSNPWSSEVRTPSSSTYSYGCNLLGDGAIKAAGRLHDRALWQRP